jgi:hypothetical protein
MVALCTTQAADEARRKSVERNQELTTELQRFLQLHEDRQAEDAADVKVRISVYISVFIVYTTIVYTTYTGTLQFCCSLFMVSLTVQSGVLSLRGCS